MTCFAIDIDLKRNVVSFHTTQRLQKMFCYPTVILLYKPRLHRVIFITNDPSLIARLKNVFKFRSICLI